MIVIVIIVIIYKAAILYCVVLSNNIEKVCNNNNNTQDMISHGIPKKIYKTTLRKIIDQYTKIYIISNLKKTNFFSKNA